MDQVVGQALATYRRLKAAEDKQRDALEAAARRATASERPAMFARSASIARTGSSEAAATPAE
jgi:hypothetical protein